MTIKNPLGHYAETGILNTVSGREVGTLVRKDHNPQAALRIFPNSIVEFREVPLTALSGSAVWWRARGKVVVIPPNCFEHDRCKYKE